MAHPSDTMSFKDTLNLPKTDFPIRANPKIDDPKMLERWQQEDLYIKTFEHNKGAAKYVVHDGPPYANGHIHLGHAYNKILKDIIGKSRRMNGMHAPLTPGWDCHGLPIELKVTKELPNLPVDVLKKECRLYAQKWIEVQRQEFKQLGVLMNWEKPYLTMDYGYEASIVRAFGKFVQQGYIQKKQKTVPWCPEDQTVLAAAEIEYKDRKDPSLYVLFDVPQKTTDEVIPSLVGKQISIVVWTTTPWTLPLNRAVLLKPKTEYVVLEIDGAFVVVAAALADKLLHTVQKPKNILATITAEHLEGVQVRHPFVDGLMVPIILDPMVSLEDGTAAVHCAPGCGPEDYELGVRQKLEIYSPISPDGRYTAEIMPVELAGMPVSQGQGWVIKKLMERGKLLHKASINHSYPHCWRCHQGLIFRATSQWFCNLEHDGLRAEALQALHEIKFLPPRSKNFLKATLEGRAEWCLSRQRSWGVPIPAVICLDCNYVFTDSNLIETVAVGIETEGIGYWDHVSLAQLPLGDQSCKQCGSNNLKKEADILDVWFDSGVSHYAVLYNNPELAFPADLYLEGVDQHRGWFQSSLLTSLILEKKACAKAFLTHGFVVDQRGHKMSKSLGNVVSPFELIEKMGVDGLRLWASSIDYAGDVVVSQKVIEHVENAFRKIRNTCRFLLSNLYDFELSKDAVPFEQLLYIDQCALYDLYRFNKEILQGYNNNNFTAVFHQFNDYTTVNLSQLYLDIIKDRLYTDAPTSNARRSAQTALFYILDTITKLMAPILSFTAEQVSDCYQKNKTVSIHLQQFADLSFIDALMQQNKLTQQDNERQQRLLFNMRDALLKIIEVQRQAGVIKHSLEAQVALSFADLSSEHKRDMQAIETQLARSGQTMAAFLKEFLIVSQLHIVENKQDLQETEFQGLYALAAHARGTKCPRCWQWHEDQQKHGLCARCAKIV